MIRIPDPPCHNPACAGCRTSIIIIAPASPSLLAARGLAIVHSTVLRALAVRALDAYR